MPLAADTIAAIEAYEAEIVRLRDVGLPPFGAPGYLAAFMATTQVRAERHAQERAVWREIDERLLPCLLDAYRDGSDADRHGIRGLLATHATFAWGLGWAGRDEPPRRDEPATVEGLRRRLTLFAMKDGVADWRDEVVALDAIVASAKAAGFDAASLLREAADLASDAPRGSRSSTRATLLERLAPPGQID